MWILHVSMVQNRHSDTRHAPFVFLTFPSRAETFFFFINI